MSLTPLPDKLLSDDLDVSHLKSFKLSNAELKYFRLPERYPAIDVVNKIKISGTTNVKDHIDLRMTPYHNAPLTLVGRRGVETIGMLGPTQGGKSVFLQSVVADTILQDPGTIIYAFPDEKSSKKAIEDKIIGMVEKTPALYEQVQEPKSRNLNVSLMRFKNMIIQPGWGGSLSSLSSTPAKRVIIDELRLFPLTIGEESNAVELLRDRLTTFLEEGSGQMYVASTPSVEGDLLHQQLEKEFTQVFLFYSKCSFCGKYQVLDFFENVKWQDKNANDAKCYCKFCKEHAFPDDNKKMDWNQHGLYAPAGYDGATTLPNWEDLVTTHNYFWFTSMVSPFRSFTRIARKFLEVKNKFHDMKNFIQCWLARFFRLSQSSVGLEGLKGRIIELPRGVVPEWCQVITAGADTQDNGLFITFRAHGSSRRTHLIDTIFIPAEIESVSIKEFAKKIVDQVEERVFSDEVGNKWTVGRWAFDTGGHRESEMKLVTSYLSKATRIKGRNTNQAVSIQPSTNIAGLFFAKTYEYLDMSENECLKEYWTLFQGVEDDYFTQFLTAKRVTEVNKKTGEKKTVWIKENGGKTDWRMAEIHNFITLDLPFGSSTLRISLEQEGFKYNPYELIRSALAPKSPDALELENKKIDMTNSYYDNEGNYGYTTTYL